MLDAKQASLVAISVFYAMSTFPSLYPGIASGREDGEECLLCSCLQRFSRCLTLSRLWFGYGCMGDSMFPMAFGIKWVLVGQRHFDLIVSRKCLDIKGF